MREEILEISNRIVEWQRPIRLLNSIRIPGKLFEEYLKNGVSAILPFTPEFYQKNELKYDIEIKKAELLEIKNRIQKSKLLTTGVRRIFDEVTDSYLQSLLMLQSRGTKEFGRISEGVYGHPKLILEGHQQTLKDISINLEQKILNLPNEDIEGSNPAPNASMTADEMTKALYERLNPYFDGEIKVVISDGIISDAAAGGDQIKIRQEARFTASDLEVFEVHEGWVHVGTTLNGRKQSYCKWLSIGAPRSTCTQEGLAILMELVAYRSTKKRMQKIIRRLQAIDLAISGANFKEVYEWHLTKNYSELESFKSTIRVFRGTTGEGGTAFCKDISYIKGLIENLDFIKRMVATKSTDQVSMLFAGKVVIGDVPTLLELRESKILDSPRFVPEVFKQKQGISDWLKNNSLFDSLKME